MKFRVLAGLLVVVSFCFLTSCTGSFSSPSNGFIFVATQGDSSVTPYAIDLSDGALTELTPVKVQNGTQPGVPLAMVLDSGGDTLFGVNTDGFVWSLAVNNDGSLGSPAFTSQSVGSQPQDIIVDSSGKFVFVANQGNAGDPTSGTVSVFSVSSGSLTLVGTVQVVNAVQNPMGTINPGPSALAVTSDTKFLYVANTFNNSIAAYSIDSSGNLTPEIFPTSVENSVGLSPSGLAVSSDGGFLYVANFGLNSLSGFAICDQTRPVPCVDVNSPNGSLTALAGPFPVPAGLGPTRMITNPAGPFVFAVGQQSNQVLSYKESPGSGALTASGSISAGTTPTAIATRAGATINSDDSTQEYLFAVNSGSAAISSYNYTSLNSSLNLITTTATQGQPVAIAIK